MDGVAGRADCALFRVAVVRDAVHHSRTALSAVFDGWSLHVDLASRMDAGLVRLGQQYKVLHHGRRRKKGAHDGTPMSERIGLAEVHRVVF